MKNIWRNIAPVALAGGLLAAGALPAQAANPATYTATIRVHTTFPKVGRDSLVVYKNATLGTATISGTVTGFVTGDTAQLMSEGFGATSFTAVGSPVALSTTGTYSFTAKPTKATKYQVEIFTGTTLDVTTATVSVFVTENLTGPKPRVSCTTTTCTEKIHAFVHLPASAFRTESRKHVFAYLAVGNPRLPRVLTLNRRATVSRARRVTASEYEITVTYHIHIIGPRMRWVVNFCTRDTESIDGLGLPGHHGCGNRTVSRSAIYLG